MDANPSNRPIFLVFDISKIPANLKNVLLGATAFALIIGGLGAVVYLLNNVWQYILAPLRSFLYEDFLLKVVAENLLDPLPPSLRVVFGIPFGILILVGFFAYVPTVVILTISGFNLLYDTLGVRNIKEEIWPPFWEPSKYSTETLTGTVEKIEANTESFGEEKLVRLRTDQGNPMRLRIRTFSSLQKAWEETQPTVGDRIEICYVGTRSSASDSTSIEIDPPTQTVK